jgi:hypothetical protein
MKTKPKNKSPRKREPYLVRSLGAGRGFGVLSTTTNEFVGKREGLTRLQARQQLRRYRLADLLRKWQKTDQDYKSAAKHSLYWKICSGEFEKAKKGVIRYLKLDTPWDQLNSLFKQELEKLEIGIISPEETAENLINLREKTDSSGIIPID